MCVCVRAGGGGGGVITLVYRGRGCASGRRELMLGQEIAVWKLGRRITKFTWRFVDTDWRVAARSMLSGFFQHSQSPRKRLAPVSAYNCYGLQGEEKVSSLRSRK